MLRTDSKIQDGLTGGDGSAADFLTAADVSALLPTSPSLVESDASATPAAASAMPDVGAYRSLTATTLMGSTQASTTSTSPSPETAPADAKLTSAGSGSLATSSASTSVDPILQQTQEILATTTPSATQSSASSSSTAVAAPATTMLMAASPSSLASTSSSTSTSPSATASTDPATPLSAKTFSAEATNPDAGAALAPQALVAAAAATGPNKIALENAKQGNPVSQWGVHGQLGGEGDGNIQGFATNMSTNVGSKVDFKIATDSKDYRIEIYRLGYYGGSGARLITTIDKTLATAQIQPHPIVDYSIGLIDCGNWSVSASWDVPADATSGVYFAKLVREDGTSGENMIPFVVRDDSSTSNVVFQTSDTTWQAYNAWGGASLYEGNVPTDPNKMIGWLPPNCSCGLQAIGRASAVSYNRPFITSQSQKGGPWDFIFGAEYPAIRWMEQNGYDMSYISGVDTSRSGNLLLNHDAFLSVGHDEYWSAEQRANVEAARAAGTNLAFWSGNEVYWKVRWENSIDGNGTPYRTMVCYKETWGPAEDPSPISTGTWRDPRFQDPGQKPENALTGTMFQVDSYSAEAIKIPYEMSNLRIWRNTAVADTLPGQTATLADQMLGYEWDSDVDNGFRPAGLINLSSTTVNVDTYLFDYGSTVGAATATHALTMYRDTASGALVFGAGTVYWSWGLDNNHPTGAYAQASQTDASVQQAMVNMFAEMGIQPTTLVASLQLATQSTDLTAPVSVISTPTATSLVEGQKITISGTASDVGGLVAGIEVSVDGGAHWGKASGTTNWTYTWIAQAAGSYKIMARAADDSLNLETPTNFKPVTVSLPATKSLWTFANKPTTEVVLEKKPVELGVKFSSSVAGLVSGIRFYKSFYNIGEHKVDLWTSSGQLIASGVSVNETLQGWQTVNFSTPVAIAANTTYIASYHTDGYYSSSTGYFNAPLTNGPLTVQAGGGVYGYGAAGTFPTGVYNNENYWVDVVFDSNTGPQTPPIAGDDSGFVASANTALTITAAALLANDSDANGDTLSITGVSAATHGTVAFNAQTNVVTFTPTAGYTGAASFTYTVSDGKGGTGTGNVALTVQPAAPTTGLSLFTSSDIPNATPDGDSVGVNLGMKFQASATGTISGIRYYKSATDTGTHTGGLYSSTGTLLAQGTFVNETASGWQTLAFATPVTIAAGTTYVAAYHSNGHYIANTNYFSVAKTNGPLTALSSAASGGNGVYNYGSTLAFPSSSFGAANYWVDVVYNMGTATNAAPVAVADSVSTSQGTTLTIAAATLLANDTDANGDTLSITGASGGVNGTATYNSAANTITFVPTAGYSGGASFVYTISDGKGGVANGNVAVTVSAAANQAPVAVADTLAANRNVPLTVASAVLLANDTDADGDTLTITGVSAPVNGTVSLAAGVVTFTPATGFSGVARFTYAISDGKGGTSSANATVNVAANLAPVAVNDTSSSFTTLTGTPLTISAATLLANDTDGNGDTLTISGVSGGVNGTASFNAATNVVTFTPTAGYTGAASFSYTIGDGNTGVATAAVSLTVTAPATGVSLFTTGDTPNPVADNDTAPVNLGMKFTASSSGTISGIRYYKSATDVGTHTGSLYSSTGTLLATGTFANETASGWQTLTFATPISIVAGTTYVASYHSNGHYIANSNYFTTAKTNGPLTALAGTNGVYTYGSGNLFPSSSFGSANYWVDVVYNQGAAAPNVAPVGVNDSGFATAVSTPLVINAASLLANDTDANGDTLSIASVGSPTNGTVSYSSTNKTVTFTPTAGYAGPATFSYTVNDGKVNGSAASVSLAVGTTYGPAQSFFSAATVGPSAVDPSSVELGLRFTSDVAGQITAIKFYKGATNTGTHTASLWSSTGTLLASATFSNETASGWQTATLSTPVTIAANTTYVASYHTSGNYSATSNFFATKLDSGNLHAAAGGSGVYAYGSTTAFPTSSWNSSNYYVDVAFKPQLAA